MSELGQYVYIIMDCTECEDRYYPPHKSIHSIYKTIEEAAVGLQELMNNPDFKRYNEWGRYYELIRGDFEKKGGMKHIMVYNSLCCYGSCLCGEYKSFPPHTKKNKPKRITTVSTKQTMEKIEKDAEEKVVNLYKTSNVTQEKVMDVLETGAKEFENIVGRPMSYSEMREMFG